MRSAVGAKQPNKNALPNRIRKSRMLRPYDQDSRNDGGVGFRRQVELRNLTYALMRQFRMLRRYDETCDQPTSTHFVC